MSKGTETRQVVLDEAARVASRVGLSGLTIGSLAAVVAACTVFHLAGLTPRARRPTRRAGGGWLTRWPGRP